MASATGWAHSEQNFIGHESYGMNAYFTPIADVRALRHQAPHSLRGAAIAHRDRIKIA
jgi:hypothetical protein